MYRNTRFYRLLGSLARLFFFQIVLAFSYIVMFKDVTETFKLSREVLLATYGASVFATTFWRFGAIKLIRFYRSRGVNNRKVIIVGAGDSGQELKRVLANKIEYGLKFVGFFDNEPDKFKDQAHLINGDVEEAKVFALKNDIEEIFCALPYKQEGVIRDLIDFCDENLIRLRIVPDFSRIINLHLSKVDIDHYGMLPILTFRKEPLENAFNRLIKRIFDFSFTMLLFATILWWLIPLIALLVRLTSKGPAFFIQQRSGERNETFNVIKFRTMYINGDSDTKQAVKGDCRITPLGKLLRKTNLDELPQFINVFFGHMSVIGPRPHMLKHTQEYSKVIDKFMVRHFIKPGITGWAQVNGYRGETKDPRLMEQRVQHDMWYIENWSLLLDIRIIFMTIINMIRGEENAF